MARLPKPWYRDDRQSWFVTIRGVRHNLGPNKKAAFERFYELMRQPAEQQSVASEGFPAIADAFLDWVKSNRSEATFEWYRYRLEWFCQRYPDLRASELKPYHVQQWVDSYKHIGRTTKRNYIRSVKRCMAWALQQGYISQNGVAQLEVPGADRREVMLDAVQFEEMLKFMPDPKFKELCEVTYQTGCRPQEILRVEARHLDETNGRWVFPISESKGKRQPRIVYLTEYALKLSKQLAAENPTGRLFRNTAGKPWTVSAVNCAFKRLQKRMGKAVLIAQGGNVRQELTAEMANDKRWKGKTIKDLDAGSKRRMTHRILHRYAAKYSLYALRHAWATRALQSGMDALSVAILMGHNDPSTLSRVYQHLAHNPAHLRQQVVGIQ